VSSPQGCCDEFLPGLRRGDW